MVSGVSKELENEIRKVLEESVNASPGSFIITTMGTELLEYDAVRYLEDIGAFEQTGSGSYRLTAYGREYWNRLTAPRRYWYRQNWFPAWVAGATVLAASASAAANIVNLVL